MVMALETTATLTSMVMALLTSKTPSPRTHQNLRIAIKMDLATTRIIVL